MTSLPLSRLSRAAFAGAALCSGIAFAQDAKLPTALTVTAYDTGNTDVRAQLGMPQQYGSCHTGRVGGYALEGHVPAREIRRLLSERPKAVGLAVPAMPVGSPGMDGPAYGGQRDPYDVLLVARDGSASVYQSYR